MTTKGFKTNTVSATVENTMYSAFWGVSGSLFQRV